jgi:SanA protein
MPEIAAMYRYVYEAGMPEGIVIIDGNNARTFDSCYRLKNVLGQNDVVLVTQGFHLPRALYLCNEVGIDAWGIDADLRSYRDIAWFTSRDWLASFLAFWDIYLKRTPTFLEN